MGAFNVVWGSSGGSAPTTPGTLIGQLVTLNQQGVPEENAEVSLQIIEGPGDAGISYDSLTWTETSDADGLVEFDGIIPDARYKVWRGDVKHNVFVAPESDSASVSSGRFSIDEFVGKD